MKILKWFILLFFLFLFLMSLSFYTRADISSVNSGGGTEIVINPNSYIQSFFSQFQTNPSTESTNNETTTPSGGGVAAPTSNIVVSPLEFNINLAINTNTLEAISVSNTGSTSATLAVSQTNLTGLVVLSNDSITIAPGETQKINVTFIAPNKTGIYLGTINIGTARVLVTLNVKSVLLLFDSRIAVLNHNALVLQGEPLNTKVTIIPMGDHVRTDVTLEYQIRDYNGTIYQTKSETLLVESMKTIYRDFNTGFLPPGDFVIGLQLIYSRGVAPSSAQFRVVSTTRAQEIVSYLIFFIIIGIILVAILIVLLLMIRIIKRYTRSIG